MLPAPGASNRAATRRQHKAAAASTAATPDQTVRQLQRLPANKRCADCSSRLPACVNLDLGTFVCMTCAGMHREQNARVKGVGHSAFSEADVAILQKAGDNDKVNAIYLANYNPQRERMKQPQDNNDQRVQTVGVDSGSRGGLSPNIGNLADLGSQAPCDSPD